MKKKDMDVQAYIEEFHKLDIREAHEENDKEKVARYLNGFRYNIQDEINLTTPRTMEECYKLDIKDEEKLQRRKERQGRGKRNTNRGRGTRHTQEDQGETIKGKEQATDI